LSYVAAGRRKFLALVALARQLSEADEKMASDAGQRRTTRELDGGRKDPKTRTLWEEITT
jgi:hypothetical protein